MKIDILDCGINNHEWSKDYQKYKKEIKSQSD